MNLPDYELLSFIGRGGYGDVWLACDQAGRHWAVKIVYRSSFDDDRPFEREYKGILRFFPVSGQSESQLRVVHVGRRDEDGCFYYIMELADDASGAIAVQPESYLPHTLRSELKSRRRIPAKEVAGLAWALSSALENLHANGLVHRDIKPGNIIFVGGRPKLADVGLVTDADLTRTYAGTEGYIPPEGPGTFRADIYSLGMTLYEACTGCDRRQFPALPENVGEFSDHSELLRLIQLINRACQPDRRKRYQSAAELRSDLERLLRGATVATGSERWKVVMGFAAAGLVLIGGVLVWLGRDTVAEGSPSGSASGQGNAFGMATNQVGIDAVQGGDRISSSNGVPPEGTTPRGDSLVRRTYSNSGEEPKPEDTPPSVPTTPRVVRERPPVIPIQQPNRYQDRVKALAVQLAEAKKNHDKARADLSEWDRVYSRAGPRRRRGIAAERTALEIRERRLAEDVKRLQHEHGKAVEQENIMKRGRLPR